ncbi:outer membrane beta-barrel protein [Candidatus Sulfurimonas marisnigri]|uniref:Outer membrane beta-barrel protein n=1 Tax=Candidatus Sulfurimonas marisnigri TaxID=2740405 RepID=A0A7S7M0U5_9BACT|nr:outer membrane beta-barrel protein [Candidatus Sulfurimonas marisnigri]QOY54908.1 outer membrane beta-barrel protein [Candidatus Sulfurimonas marisnigri]
MKRLIATALLGSSLLATQVMAEEPSTYIGLDIASNSNSFTLDVNGFGSADFDDDSSGFKLKFGTVSNNGWRVQGYFQRETYDETLFDNTNDALNEIGFDVIKGFEVTPEFSPFLQVGLGYGWMSVEGYDESSIAELSLKIGGGVMYKIVPSFEIIAGVDFQYRKWQDIQIIGVTVSTTEDTTKLYVGANFHF